MDFFLPPSCLVCRFLYNKFSRTIVVLTIFSLLLLLVPWSRNSKLATPDPNAYPPHRRKIQFAASGTAAGAGGPANGRRFEEDRRISNLSITSEENEQFNLPILSSSQFLDVPKKTAALEKGRLSVLAMFDRGMKLSPQQTKILDLIPETDRKGLREKVKKNHVLMEKMYFQQLRKNDQIRTRPGGGRYIISTSKKMVRFPMSLKKKDPRDWTLNDEVFMNITHFPWPSTEICEQFSTSFAPFKSLRASALASFPSSGNTWVRYLVEGATGIFTGSMYDDWSLVRKGMYGEGVPFHSGMTILQKTHGFTTGDGVHLEHSERIKYNHMDELNRQGVLVIRNPFKALISHRNLDVGGHTGYAPQHHFQGKGWHDFLSLKIDLWRDFYLDWLAACRPQDIHVVLYEDLTTDPLEVVRGMLRFLKIHIEEERLRCLSKNSDGVFKRKAPKIKNVPDKDTIPLDMKLKIYEAIRDVNESLVSKGKKQLPVLRYEMYDFNEALQRPELNSIL